MIEKLFTILLLDIVSAKTNDQIAITIHPEKLADKFKSLFASEYLRNLAVDFAMKAVKYAVDTTNSDDVDFRPPFRKKPEEFILNDNEAMALLKDPSPDGDNLDLVSPGLSQEEHLEVKKDKKTPLQKINGVYFRKRFET